MDDMPISDLLTGIKRQLQSHQTIINRAANTTDAVTRLNFRAELDALWAAVEVITQAVDGVPTRAITVRDYFTD